LGGGGEGGREITSSTTDDRRPQDSQVEASGEAIRGQRITKSELEERKIQVFGGAQRIVESPLQTDGTITNSGKS